MLNLTLICVNGQPAVPQPDIDGLISVVAPANLKFGIAPNLGPLRQNSVKAN
jgi:hypothetical protein